MKSGKVKVQPRTQTTTRKFHPQSQLQPLATTAQLTCWDSLLHPRLNPLAIQVFSSMFLATFIAARRTTSVQQMAHKTLTIQKSKRRFALEVFLLAPFFHRCSNQLTFFFFLLTDSFVKTTEFYSKMI